ncbi:hypothetical protein AB751O23_AP_00100 [Chlamydiales bacterium SCGC AB-751-O23]|jgi:hypothetical protein|nr:hypothetical protein AB751O23_AP_00100 [Chlamydiales bacterium SCGC AB-751-O23]
MKTTVYATIEKDHQNWIAVRHTYPWISNENAPSYPHSEIHSELIETCENKRIAKAVAKCFAEMRNIPFVDFQKPVMTVGIAISTCYLPVELRGVNYIAGKGPLTENLSEAIFNAKKVAKEENLEYLGQD